MRFNLSKIIVIIKLVKTYTEVKIFTKNIVIFTKYTAQV